MDSMVLWKKKSKEEVINGILIREVETKNIMTKSSLPVELMDFISVIEKTAGKTAIKQMMGMQPGDVVCTYADTGRLEKDFGYKPSTSIEEGIQKFGKRMW